MSTIIEMNAPARNARLTPVARAVDYLVARQEEAPPLDEIAASVGLSPAHFQRLFKAGTGVSPKRFLQYLAAVRAKSALRAGETVLDAAYAAGLSGPGRLHDLMLVADAVTPGAYRRKGEGLVIRHAVIPGPFGRAHVGVTDEGICWLSFPGECGPGDDGEARSQEELAREYPAAELVRDARAVAPVAERAFAFAAGIETGAPVRLHVCGTNFQIKVWEALLTIPPGATTTYGALACTAGRPRAPRAVGAAVGANPVSLLIPCHRVILASGAIHNYRWGVGRKQALLAFEGARACARLSA